MIKAVAWDIDGTLVDSEPLHLRALLAVCTAHDVDISDLPDDRFVGVNLYGVWQVLRDRFPRDLQRTDWIDQINHYYAAHKNELAAIPHAAEVIQKLADRGIPQVAVSNSNRVVVDANLQVLGVEDVLSFSLSLDDVDRGKPNPLPFLMAADHLELPPGAILAVEDSTSGRRAARAAGLVVAAFEPSGGTPPKADMVIGSLREILNVSMGGPADGIQD